MTLFEKAKQFRKATQFCVLHEDVSNNDALEMMSAYNYWSDNSKPYGGEKDEKIVRRNIEGVDVLFKCILPHTSQSDWPPEMTPAMWRRIDTEHSGTIDDPIPAARSMEYTYGLYYLDPEDNNVYLCKRTGEPEGGTVVLQYLPHELIGQYFEAVTI